MCGFRVCGWCDGGSRLVGCAQCIGYIGMKWDECANIVVTVHGIPHFSALFFKPHTSLLRNIYEYIHTIHNIYLSICWYILTKWVNMVRETIAYHRIGNIISSSHTVLYHLWHWLNCARFKQSHNSCHFQLYSSHDDYNCTIQGSLFHLIPIASIHFFNWGPWQRAHGVLNECYSIVNAEK